MQLRTYLAIASLALLVIGPALAHFELVPPLAGFGLFVLSALLGLVVTVWGVVAAIKQGSLATYLPSAMGLPALVLIIIGAMGARGHPRINDISTDLNDPPALTRAASYPESFKPIVAKHYPGVTTLVVSAEPKVVFERALAIAKARQDWTIDRTDAETTTFEGRAKTKLFRFVDDFVVRVRKRDGGSAVDMRSRSRDGKGDLGKNAARIRAFLADLKAAL